MALAATQSVQSLGVVATETSSSSVWPSVVSTTTGIAGRSEWWSMRLTHEPASVPSSCQSGCQAHGVQCDLQSAQLVYSWQSVSGASQVQLSVTSPAALQKIWSLVSASSVRLHSTGIFPFARPSVSHSSLNAPESEAKVGFSQGGGSNVSSVREKAGQKVVSS